MNLIREKCCNKFLLTSSNKLFKLKQFVFRGNENFLSTITVIENFETPVFPMKFTIAWNFKIVACLLRVYREELNAPFGAHLAHMRSVYVSNGISRFILQKTHLVTSPEIIIISYVASKSFIRLKIVVRFIPWLRHRSWSMKLGSNKHGCINVTFMCRNLQFLFNSMNFPVSLADFYSRHRVD